MDVGIDLQPEDEDDQEDNDGEQTPEMTPMPAPGEIEALGEKLHARVPWGGATSSSPGSESMTARGNARTMADSEGDEGEDKTCGGGEEGHGEGYG